MNNCLFPLRFFLCFFLCFFLLMSYSPSSYAKRVFYKDRIRPAEEVIICNKEGVEKLLKMRTKQWEEKKVFDPNDPIPSLKEGCIRSKTNVVFLEVAEEYSFKYKEYLSMENLEYGKYPCPWDPDKRCISFKGPVVQYAKAQYLDSDGKWYKDVFVEIAGDVVFESHPDDIQKEGRSPIIDHPDDIKEEDRSPINALNNELSE